MLINKNLAWLPWRLEFVLIIEESRKPKVRNITVVDVPDFLLKSLVYTFFCNWPSGVEQDYFHYRSQNYSLRLRHCSSFAWSSTVLQLKSQWCSWPLWNSWRRRSLTVGSVARREYWPYLPGRPSEWGWGLVGAGLVIFRANEISSPAENPFFIWISICGDFEWYYQPPSL